jgi:hypothetical protein
MLRGGVPRHVIVHCGERQEITPYHADVLTKERIIYESVERSTAAEYIYHTTERWDERCSHDGKDPVWAALARAKELLV